MLAKTLIAATLALAASVSAQTMPNHISFTDPVSAADDTSLVYIAGKNITFSWSMSCTTGDWISPTPTQVPVQLVNSKDSNAVGFLQQVTTIDCTGTQGNDYWVVPTQQADVPGGVYSLRIQVGANAAYSGKFQIKSANAPAASSGAATQPTTTAATPKNGAGSIVAPVLSGAAAIAAGALMFL